MSSLPSKQIKGKPKYINSLINMVLAKIATTIRNKSAKSSKEKELPLAASYNNNANIIESSKKGSSTGYPILFNSLKEVHGIIRVFRPDVIDILSNNENKKNWKFKKPKKNTKEPEVIEIINDIIMTKFTREIFQKKLPFARKQLILLIDVLSLISGIIWENIPEKYKEGESVTRSRSRKNIIISRAQESALIEPMIHVARDIMGLKNFTIKQHPSGKTKFPDAIIIDNETGEILANFESKGKKAKTTEKTHKQIEEKGKGNSGIKKLLSVKEMNKEHPLTKEDVFKILKIYNVDKENIYYFTVDRKDKKTSVKRLSIPFEVYDRFSAEKSKTSKTGMSYYIHGHSKDNSGKEHKHGLLRIEFRPSSVPVPTIKEEILTNV